LQKNGPLFKNEGGHASITGGWFRAANLDTNNAYPMVEVAGGYLILNGTQGEAGMTNGYDWGIQIDAGAFTVNVVGNQFTDVKGVTPWNTSPTTHAGNTLNGVCVDTC